MYGSGGEEGGSSLFSGAPDEGVQGLVDRGGLGSLVPNDHLDNPTVSDEGRVVPDVSSQPCK